MNPIQSLQNRIYEARSLAYIPDADGCDFVEALVSDVWETAVEVSARGGADCDGISVWTIQRGWSAAQSGEWSLVAGRVKQRGQWNGHAWVSLIHDGAEYWADPTWGWLPKTPAEHGYPDSRVAERRWTYNGVIFAQGVDYIVKETV